MLHFIIRIVERRPLLEDESNPFPKPEILTDKARPKVDRRLLEETEMITKKAFWDEEGNGQASSGGDGDEEEEGYTPKAEEVAKALGTSIEQFDLLGDLSDVREAANLPGLAALESDLRALEASLTTILSGLEYEMKEAAKARKEARLKAKAADTSGGSLHANADAQIVASEGHDFREEEDDVDDDNADEIAALNPYVRKVAPFAETAKQRLEFVRKAVRRSHEAAEEALQVLCDDTKGNTSDRHLALMHLISSFLVEWREAGVELDKIQNEIMDKKRRRIEEEKRKEALKRLREEKAAAAEKQRLSRRRKNTHRRDKALNGQNLDLNDLFGSFFDMQSGADADQLADQFTNLRDQLNRRRDMIAEDEEDDEDDAPEVWL